MDADHGRPCVAGPCTGKASWHLVFVLRVTASRCGCGVVVLQRLGQSAFSLLSSLRLLYDVLIGIYIYVCVCV